MRDALYHEAIGSLMWACLSTRPNIAFAITTLSCFSQNLGIAHWEAAKRVFCYLKGMRDLWLTYGGNAVKLIGYTDADGSMSEDRRATNRYAFILNNSAISWNCKKQEIGSLSTTESKYIAATHAAKEALWLQMLMSQLFMQINGPTALFSDNQSAITLAKDHQYHTCTKHIDIRFHFICWVIENGSLCLMYCPTEDMLADTLIKALPSAKAKHFTNELGLRTV
jgi:hypothetical protein